MLEKAIHSLNKKDLDNKFIWKVRFEAKKVKGAGTLLELFLKYYNSIEGYISEVEIENLRLVQENQSLNEELNGLRSDYTDTSNELISGLINRVKHIDKKYEARRSI